MTPKRLLRRFRREHSPATGTHSQTAQRIQHNHPGWQVAWNSHTQRFWACPASGQRPELAVSATCPHRLITRMTTTDCRRRTQHLTGSTRPRHLTEHHPDEQEQDPR